jgi:hypothetical protein
MKLIIQYLPLPELYNLYNTNKYFVKLLNDPAILRDLNNDYDIKPVLNFDDFINTLILYMKHSLEKLTC